MRQDNQNAAKYDTPLDSPSPPEESPPTPPELNPNLPKPTIEDAQSTTDPMAVDQYGSQHEDEWEGNQSPSQQILQEASSAADNHTSFRPGSPGPSSHSQNVPTQLLRSTCPSPESTSPHPETGVHLRVNTDQQLSPPTRRSTSFRRLPMPTRPWRHSKSDSKSEPASGAEPSTQVLPIRHPIPEIVEPRLVRRVYTRPVLPWSGKPIGVPYRQDVFVQTVDKYRESDELPEKYKAFGKRTLRIDIPEEWNNEWYMQDVMKWLEKPYSLVGPFITAIEATCNSKNLLPIPNIEGVTACWVRKKRDGTAGSKLRRWLGLSGPKIQAKSNRVVSRNASSTFEKVIEKKREVSKDTSSGLQTETERKQEVSKDTSSVLQTRTKRKREVTVELSTKQVFELLWEQKVTVVGDDEDTIVNISQRGPFRKKQKIRRETHGRF